MRYVVTMLTVLVLLVFCDRPAVASPVMFSFSGDRELKGQFILDDAASFTFSNQFEATVATLSSPIQRISGTYGAYSFDGSINLVVTDRPAFSGGQETLLNDSWIGRSTLSGPDVDGRSLTNLNLFVYTSAASLNGASLTPPPFVLSPSLFQYTVRFSDGTIAAAPLTHRRGKHSPAL